jgi:tRNA threonylcarbamoyladenosine biosynthesis protein TsaB
LVVLIRLLALDTSTWWGSVALVEGGTAERPPRVIVEIGERVDDSHAEHLLDWIGRALERADWPKSSVDTYVATRGPGSFTGIRVSLGTVRGLALATGRPCVGVTTLEAIAAAHGPCERERHPVMDAGRGELYAARYDAGSTPPFELSPPRLGAAEEVLASAAARECTIVTGPGTRIDSIPGAERAAVTASPLRLAGAAGRIAAFREPDAEPLAPLYIRPPDARIPRGRP